MKLTVNGKSEHYAPEDYSAEEYPHGFTVLALLKTRNINPAVAIVEINREILPAEKFATHQLREADVLEILFFVGGG